MTLPIETRQKTIQADLLIALISLLVLLIAKPLFAQNIAQNTMGTTQPGGSLNPSITPQSVTPTMTATPGPNQLNTSQSTYLNPPTATPTVTPGSSQSQRDANARQNGTNLNNPQLQPLPECRIEDTACIEQRNRLNQTNPQTAPTFNR